MNYYTKKKCLFTKIIIPVGNNNNNSSNAENEKNFTNENNRQTSENKLSFITLPYTGQQGEKIIRSLKTALHKSLPNIVT